jgi:hypothetical protein
MVGLAVATSNAITPTPSYFPPTNIVAPVISGNTDVVMLGFSGYYAGNTLTSTTGTWTGFPAPTFTYQWYRGYTLISGQTNNNTYVTHEYDVAHPITCKVRGTNASGFVIATSNPLTPVLRINL